MIPTLVNLFIKLWVLGAWAYPLLAYQTWYKRHNQFLIDTFGSDKGNDIALWWFYWCWLLIYSIALIAIVLGD